MRPDGWIKAIKTQLNFSSLKRFKTLLAWPKKATGKSKTAFKKKFFGNVVLGWFLSILTMVVNGLVIFLVSNKRQLRTKTNAFIVSLAVADFCVGMFAAPSRLVCNMLNECITDKKARLHMMKVWVFFICASGTNLFSLVLERYIAVVKPLKYLTFMKRRRVIQMFLHLGEFLFFSLLLMLYFRLDSIHSILRWLSSAIYICFSK